MGLQWLSSLLVYSLRWLPKRIVRNLISIDAKGNVRCSTDFTMADSVRAGTKIVSAAQATELPTCDSIMTHLLKY